MAPRVKSLEDVKRVVAAGVTVAGAIRELLSQADTTASGFALRHNVGSTHISRVLNQREVPSADFLSALARDFGGEPAEWAPLFPQQAPMRDLVAAGGR